MAPALPDPRAMSVEEYLATEWDEKTEYIHGWVYGMAGGSAVHAVLCMNVGIALGVALRGRPCRVASSDLRLFVAETGAYLFPDLQVVCPPWEMGEKQAVTNPTVLVEVLSPTTRQYDSGAKLGHYQRVPSLQSYLIVDPVRQEVHHYRRNASGWQVTTHAEGHIPLDAIDVQLAVADVFADLDDVPSP